MCTPAAADLFAAAFLFTETLNQSSAADGGSFSSIHRYEKLEIHKVFLRFPYLDLPKNLSPSALAD